LSVIRILLVGLGKMGGALLAGWGPHSSYILSTFDPHNTDADYHSASDIKSQFDILILAVKPQVIGEVTASLKHVTSPHSLVISIAAGKNISFFASLLRETQPIIRAMPNTPALIGQGMTVLCGNGHVTDTQKEMALNLLSSVGQTEWIEDEKWMDAVTAVSGSGPAYVFNLIEAMTAAGVAAGLPAPLSEKLARQTVIGAAALAESDKNSSPSTLRENVTSKGGTTEAALNILMSEDGLTRLMTQAILAAQKRGKDLAS
jgi:pyrroline-5-carboxylate reductase